MKQSTTTSARHFDDALRRILSVSKKDVDKAMAAEKKKRAKKRRKNA